MAKQTKSILLSRASEVERAAIERRIRGELDWYDADGTRFDVIPSPEILTKSDFGYIWNYPKLSELRLDAVHWPSHRFSIRCMTGPPLQHSGLTLYYNIQDFNEPAVHSISGERCSAILSFMIRDDLANLIGGVRMPGIAYAEFVHSIDNGWIHYQYCFDDEAAHSAEARDALYRTMLTQFVLGFKLAEVVRENEDSLKDGAALSSSSPVAVALYSAETPHTARVAVNRLRSLLATAATKDIISFATAIFIMGRKNAEETYGLSSPYRQAQFLLGLLSSTPELTPEATSPTTQYETIAKLLEAAFTAYAREIFVLERDGRPITPEAVRDVEIAGGAIINHYMAGRLATVDQTKNRIRGVFRSVDDRLETVCGLRSTDILAICDWITTAVLARLDEHRHTEVAFRNLHESWSNEVRGLNDSDAMALPSYAAVGAAAADWSASLQTINTFSRVALIATFADKAAAFLRLFVTSRGANPAFREVGARNPARYAPLFALDDDLIAMPLGNGLYDGVLDTLSELSRNNFSEAYARARGKYVERRVAELFRTLFPASAMLLCNCFQDPASRDEHDLVILHDRVLYVIESKGAPPIAPPTDARRAAVRLERAFGSDRGIQYGFSQARKVLDKIDAGESVRFYRRDRNVALELGPDEIDSEFAVIVTGDDFGALACDLATLLKKAPCEPYPWAVNLYDLESLLEGFRMRDWGPPEFRRFLEQRQGLHGHIIASDELDVAGAFLRYGSLEMLPIEPDTKIQMDFGEIFDEIYVANLGGPDVAWGTGPPSFVDLRSQLTQIMMKDDSSALWEGVLPLDPCPCGSTLRYRDCHGIE